MIEISIHYPIGQSVSEPLRDRVRLEFVRPKRPLLFWVERDIGERLDLPKGYGVAWYDCARAKLLYAPLPFNLAIGFGIWLWAWFKTGAVRWMIKHIPKRNVNARSVRQR